MSFELMFFSIFANELIHRFMFRKAEIALADWKNRKLLKPLILTGARQVGKTWLMKNLGKQHFEHSIYINLEKEPSYRNLFEADLNIERIIQTISLLQNQKVEDGKTLLIFDEIQEAPNALTSLKYFAEDRPGLHVLAAGSLLGVTLDTGSFPVGKVDFLKILPMSFEEFLKATCQSALWELLLQQDYTIVCSFRDKYIHALRNYYLVGGMPEAVLAFASDGGSFYQVKRIQEAILNSYMQDFAKHAPAVLIPKIIAVWHGMVSQLAKENKKFVYGLLKSGARAREYEDAIDWLVNYGLVHKIYAVQKMAFPLHAYKDLKSFKLFAFDVGLLSHLAHMSPVTILENAIFFEEFKGALTEQYVLQELIVAEAKNISYWVNDIGTAELDFVFEKNGVIYPLEVKATENLQAKSLKVFHEKHKEIHCYRTSLSNYREEGWMTNVPLYAISTFPM
jgi:predicted AAA+ superfamily ATPase